MILGVGSALQSVKELRDAIDSDPGFLSSRFTSDEIAYCEAKRYPATHFAARLAAKRALQDALGLAEASWLEMSVVHTEAGRPILTLSGSVDSLARALGVTAVHASLSHTRDVAAAFVILT